MNIWLFRLTNLGCALALLMFVIDWLPSDGLFSPRLTPTAFTEPPPFSLMWQQLQLPLLLANLIALLWIRRNRHKH